jgi:hypothetical protein
VPHQQKLVTVARVGDTPRLSADGSRKTERGRGTNASPTWFSRPASPTAPRRSLRKRLLLEPEPEEPAFANELDFLEYVWRDPTKPDRLRYMAAKACADFHFPSLKAIAQVTSKDFASAVEAAQLRAASVANVIQMKVLPKVLQHSADELKPNHSKPRRTVAGI